jgi:SAM-dependent methyltransferase
MDEAIYDELFAIEERHWWFRGRRAVVHALFEHVRTERDGAMFLDVGCGSGRNLEEFANGRGIGTEFAPDAVEVARKRGIDCRQADAQALPFGDGEFQIVTAFDVIEHVPDDRAAFAEAHRVAAPGASMVVTVPAYQWLWSQHDETHGHQRRYTRGRLVAAAQSAGWHTRFATYFNTLLLPPIAVVRAFRRGEGAAATDYSLTGERLGDALTLPMRAEAQLIRRGVRLPAGVSVGAVFERS